MTEAQVTEHRSQVLEKLGEGSTRYDYKTSDQILEAFATPKSKGGATTVVHLDCPEFTAKCPKTNQPDFGRFDIYYIPNELCVESKSLKLYLGAFREEGHFHEEVAVKIHDDLVSLILYLLFLVPFHLSNYKK